MGGVISLATGWTLARTWYHDRLRSEWRRKTVKEAEAVFESLGLISEFWRLS
jgi:hypothetical protein